MLYIFCFYCRRSYYLYILQDICLYFTRNTFYSCYSYNSVKVLESLRISSKVLEKSWNFDAKSPVKSEKTSWNLNQYFWSEPCCNVIKKETGTGVFLWFLQDLRTLFLRNTSGRLLLFANSCWLYTLQLYIAGNFQNVKSHKYGKKIRPHILRTLQI